MGADRFGFELADHQMDVAKVRESQRGDAYLIFPMLNTGLHISIHSPKPERGLEAHAHVKDNNRNYGEIPVDSLEPSPETAQKFLENVQKVLRQPEPDDEFLFFENIRPDEYVKKVKNGRYIDLQEALLEFPWGGTIRKVFGRALDAYIQTRKGERVVGLDPHRGQLITPLVLDAGIYVWGIEFDANPLEMLAEFPIFGDFIDPLMEAMQAAEDRREAGDEILTERYREFGDDLGEEEIISEEELEERWSEADIDTFDVDDRQQR